jgi:hypothetical protein
MSHFDSDVRKPAAATCAIVLASIALAACGSTSTGTGTGARTARDTTASVTGSAEATSTRTATVARGETSKSAGRATGRAAAPVDATPIRDCSQRRGVKRCRVLGDSTVSALARLKNPQVKAALAKYTVCRRGARLASAEAKCRNQLLMNAFINAHGAGGVR